MDEASTFSLVPAVDVLTVQPYNLSSQNASTWHEEQNTGSAIFPSPLPSHTSTEDYDTKYKTIYDIFNCYLTPVLCVFGCLGNIINVIVLTHRRFCMLNGCESGSRVGLVVLALSDMLFCIVLFPRGFLYTAKSLFTHKDFWLLYQVYGTGLVTTFILSSTWITVALAMLRYLAICHPFRIRRIDGNLCSKIVYSSIFILSAITNIPSFYQFKILTLELGNETMYLIDIGYMDNRQTAGKIFQIFHLLFFLVFPLALLVFCNISLIRALRKSQRIRQQFNVPTHLAKSQNRITLMLIIIAVSFLILVLPSEIMGFFIDFVKMDYKRTEVFLLMRTFANLLQLISFSCNFLIYCFCNLHFRKVIRDIVLCSNSGYFSRRQSCISRNEFARPNNASSSNRSSAGKNSTHDTGSMKYLNGSLKYSNCSIKYSASMLFKESGIGVSTV